MLDTSSVDQRGVTWTFTITPNASVQPSVVSGVAVSGASVNLSTNLSSGIKAPRFNPGPKAYGYADAEVNAPTLGDTYFNTAGVCGSASLRQYSNAGWQCGGGLGGLNGVGVPMLNGAKDPFVLTPIFQFSGFGDSYVYGAGAVNPATQSGFALIAQGVHAPSTNYAISGSTAPRIAKQVFANWAAFPSMPSVAFIDGGANDGSQDTCGGGATTVCMKNFSQAMNAAIARTAIPTSTRIMASTATASGAWTADSALAIMVNPYRSNPGTAMTASSSGASLTFSVPSSDSSIVGVTFEVANSQTGTFTVSVDGTLQTDLCSGTTTFTSAPCSTNLLQETVAPFRQAFAVTPNTSHTVVITTTNSALVDVVSVDWIDSATAATMNPTFVMGPNAVFQYATTYNTVLKSIADGLLANGLPVYYVDQINGTPGVNSTTDLSTTATATCNASAQASHPNSSCGYVHMAQTVENVEQAVGYHFSAPLGSGLIPDSTRPTLAASNNFTGASNSFKDVYVTAQGTAISSQNYNSSKYYFLSSYYGADGLAHTLSADIFGNLGAGTAPSYLLTFEGPASFGGTRTLSFTTNWDKIIFPPNTFSTNNVANGAQGGLGLKTTLPLTATNSFNTTTFACDTCAVVGSGQPPTAFLPNSVIVSATSTLTSDYFTNIVRCSAPDIVMTLSPSLPGQTWEIQNDNTAGMCTISYSGGIGNSVQTTTRDVGPNEAIVVSWTGASFTIVADGRPIGTIAIASSATPVFSTGWNVNRYILNGNVTSSTIPSGTDGQRLCMNIVQDATGGRTFVWPTNMAGPPVDKTANAVTSACFNYQTASSVWRLEGAIERTESGTVTLSGGTATYAPKLNYSATPNCWANDTTALAVATANATSTTSVTVNGTGSDVINVFCRGK
jgi:hypothetical protein